MMAQKIAALGGAAARSGCAYAIIRRIRIEWTALRQKRATLRGSLCPHL
jgi:hypothetical protein